MSTTSKQPIVSKAARAKMVDDFISEAKVDNPDFKGNKEENNKRLTIDIPASLHRTIKLKSVNDGVTMVELIRQVLADNF